MEVDAESRINVSPRSTVHDNLSTKCEGQMLSMYIGILNMPDLDCRGEPGF